MRKSILILACGALLAWGVQNLHISFSWGSASAQTAPPATRHLAAPPWSVYNGASVCTIHGQSVACDNGYDGPIR
jgi:hypothetical protein